MCEKLIHGHTCVVILLIEYDVIMWIMYTVLTCTSGAESRGGGKGALPPSPHFLKEIRSISRGGVPPPPFRKFRHSFLKIQV